MQEKNIRHSGNLSLDDVIEIARIMRDRSCAKQLKGTVKEILGTCRSVGCTVEHEDPSEMHAKVLLACLSASVKIKHFVHMLPACTYQVEGVSIHCHIFQQYRHVLPKLRDMSLNCKLLCLVA